MIDALMSTIDQCAAHDPSGEITRRLIAGGAAKTILEALRCAPQVPLAVWWRGRLPLQRPTQSREDLDGFQMHF